jgi:hypothetical protein
MKEIIMEQEVGQKNNVIVKKRGFKESIYQ